MFKTRYMMTSVDGRFDDHDEGSVDPVPVAPNDAPEATPSTLEQGQHLESGTAPDETPDGDFDVKVIDIAKDGTHRILYGAFENQQYSDHQTAMLVARAPKDHLRVLIAERTRGGSPLELPSERWQGGNRAKKTSQAHELPHGWRLGGKIADRTGRIWEPHDPGQFRRLFRYYPEDQHAALWGSYHLWAEYRELLSCSILVKWIAMSPEYLTGVYVPFPTSVRR